ncbi:MAG: C1 family peptidase [Clostridium sp.]|uniref:C1 family peptidase n=1 Tax=Clostridium sp. TaxID=1506 RepID=UPI0039EA95B0
MKNKEKNHHILKDIVTVILPIIITFNLLGHSVFASEVNKNLKVSSINSVLNSKSQLNLNKSKVATKGKGLIPYKVKIKKSAESLNSQPRLKSAAPLPASYDLRKTGRITIAKDQGQLNNCWAFSAIGSLESNLLRIEKKTYDFSEINMTTHNNIDNNPFDGGNNEMATAYLASWKGPVNETDDSEPSDPNNIVTRNGLKEKKHVQEVLFIPDRTGALDNSELKKAIMNYGAVSSSLYMDEYSYFNLGKNAYYDYAESSGNHAIDIVGWDDNYSKNNFLVTPKGNGAFICKNSWGTSFGDKGYFYVSYYDVSIGIDNAVFNGIEPVDNYSKNYQYDLDYNGIVSFGQSNWFSNVFTASANSTTMESLAAVSFYTDKENVSYSVYAENDYSTNKFNKIASNLVASGIIAMPGYHTIKLPKPLSLNTGKKFAVAVKVTGSSIPLDYLSNSNGNSFVSNNGSKWAAIPAAVDLKAFTNISSKVSVKGISLNSSFLNINVNSTAKLSSSISPSNATNKNVSWSSSNSKIATVDNSGNVKGILPGKAVITVKSQDGNFAAQCTVNVKGTIAVNSVSFGSRPVNINSDFRFTFPSTIYKGTNFKYITLKDNKNANIAINVSINNNVLILKPKNNLKNGTMYFINIPVNSVIDGKDSTLLKDYSTKFVTIPAYNPDIKFTDANLEKKIRSVLKKPKGNISSNDMAALTFLDISCSNITSLKGLEYAVNLISVNAKGNKITDTSPM